MTTALVRRNVLTVVGAAAMGLAMVMPALAVDSTTEAVVTGGEFSWSNDVTASDFGGVTIGDTTQTTKATLSGFTVSDLRGNGKGWTVIVAATQFSTGLDGKTLDAGSLTIAEPVANAGAATGEEQVPGANETTGGVIDNSGSVTVIDTDADKGMGNFNVGSTELTLSVPPDAYAGTYTSVVTVTAAATP